VVVRAPIGINRKAVTPSEHQRKAIQLNRGRDRASDAPSHRDDAIEIFESGISNATCFENGDFDVTFIFHGAAHFFELLLKMGIADGAGTHVHTAAVRAEIDGTPMMSISMNIS